MKFARPFLFGPTKYIPFEFILSKRMPGFHAMPHALCSTPYATHYLSAVGNTI
jgi:hypothetical protein